MIEILPNWHPVLVHFTVALLIIAAAMHLLSHFLPKGELANQMTFVARWNLWIGIGFTLLTVVAGWYAYNTVVHDEPSHIAMIEHRNWAMATFVVLLGIAGWEYYLSRRGKARGWLFTGLMVIAAVLLLSTAWHGSELVYRHGLGVMSLPKAEGPNHNHEHANGHGDMPVPGEEKLHEDGHEHNHDDMANGSSVAPKKTHSHTPGTPPHKD